MLNHPSRTDSDWYHCSVGRNDHDDRPVVYLEQSNNPRVPNRCTSSVPFSTLATTPGRSPGASTLADPDRQPFR